MTNLQGILKKKEEQKVEKHVRFAIFDDQANPIIVSAPKSSVTSTEKEFINKDGKRVRFILFGRRYQQQQQQHFIQKRPRKMTRLESKNQKPFSRVPPIKVNLLFWQFICFIHTFVFLHNATETGI